MRYDLDSDTYSASATDLANHARCTHLTQLRRHEAREIAAGRAEREEAPPTLAQEKGRQHEAAYVAARRAEGVTLQTQAWLESGALAGYADLLELAPDGATWEPHEIKFARSVQPAHLLQVLMYADALNQRDGVMPERVHVIDGRSERHSFATADYLDYYRAAKQQLEAALTLDVDAEYERVPEPVPFCAECPLIAHCTERWQAADHLSLVARIRADQRAKLTAAGITTLAELAASELEHVPGIGRATLATLTTQARLQHAARTTGAVPVEYRTPAEGELPGRGFARLPEPDPADMFFDFEGYPFHDSGGLEYLWGWTSHDAADPADPAAATRFDYLWAGTEAEEAAAFTHFLDIVHERRAAAPDMHVYHYAPYEITALRRLAAKHPHEMPRLDDLLRAGVFIDLYAVVRQALVIGTPSYSIKQLEPLYGRTRAGAELADGGASIEVFEQWLLTGSDTIRQQIIDYNKDDTDSTLELRDWLITHKRNAAAAGIEWPCEQPAAAGDTDHTPAEAAETAEPDAALLARNLNRLADDAQQPADVRRVARLLSDMSGWQWRVRREFFGELYARAADADADDFVHEATTLGGLELIDIGPIQRSLLYRFRFPAQATTLKVGDDALDAMRVEKFGKVVAIDFDERIVSIKVSKKFPEAGGEPPRAVVGWSAIPLKQLEKAVEPVAAVLLAAAAAGRDPFAPDAPFAAALGILAQRASRAEGIEAAGTDSERIAQVIAGAEGSHVIVQGPPGTGKTYTSVHVIRALVRAGLRVGISSNSHEAVINVLRGIDRVDGGREIRAAYPLRTSSGEKAPGWLDFGDGWLTRTRSPAEAQQLLEDGDVQVLAGTAWLFARRPPVDVVLIDEAGQVSLLHATTIAASAPRVVLVGDPQQLPQPNDASHPTGLEASVLDHLFGGASVLPADEAVLLDTTYRMRADVTDFISRTYYEGALEAFHDNEQQHVTVDGRQRTGIEVLPVDHAGNRVRSDEEVAAVVALVDELVARGEVIARPGEQTRRIRRADIIVVAPYNAQRVALQTALGDDVRVGTVDKFQGQEAPIAILSLTASSRDELPRGLEFLLDPHRMNVAISRARSLAIVVCSPQLARTSAGSIAEMRLLNDLVRLTGEGARALPLPSL